jgi:WD40 repeat protein
MRSGVYCCSFSRDGDFFAFANGQTIFVVDTTRGAVTSTFEIPNPQNSDFCVRAIRISPHSKFLGVSGPMNSVMLYCVASHRLITRFDGHRDAVSALQFTGDSLVLFSGGLDGVLCAWDLVGMSLVRQMPHRMFDHPEAIWSLSMDPEGNFLVVGFVNGTVGLYRLDFKQPMNPFVTHCDQMMAVATTANQMIATAANDKAVKIWELRGVVAMRHSMEGHQESVVSLCFSPIGSVLMSGSGDKTVKLWDYTKGELLFTLQAHDGTVFGLEHHPSERCFLSCSDDCVICLWEYDL